MNSAVRDKPLLVSGLARNRRSPKRPSEPRPSGVHPEEVEEGERWRSLPLEIVGRLEGAFWRKASLMPDSCAACRVFVQGRGVLDGGYLITICAQAESQIGKVAPT